MIRVVNGKKYNTDKSEELANCKGGGNFSDFRYWEETLYRTKNGRLFVAGYGGPLSKYSIKSGNESHGSEVILPMSESEALEWCEENQIEPPTCLDHLVEEA
jgi:hypothetical protein